MIISARFPVGAVAAALALSLMGGAANADVYEATPIYISFNFGTAGALTADTGNLATATTIASSAPYFVTTIDGSNIGFVTGPIGLINPTPVTLHSTFTKSFMTTLGVSFTESLTVTSATFAPAPFAAAALLTPGTSSNGTLVIAAAGTISETPESTASAGTGFTTTPVFYAATYTQINGQISGSFSDTTTPLPAALPLFATGLGALGLLGWRRKRKSANSCRLTTRGNTLKALVT